MNPRFIDEMSWRMGEVYGAVTDEILVNMARHFKYMTEGNAPSGTWEYQTIKLAEMGQVNQETEAIILKHLGDADGALRYVLEESIRDGLKNAEPALRKAAEKGFTRKASVPELAPNQMQAFRAFYNQSSDKLNLVNTVMLDSTQQAYQATVSDIVGRMQRTQGILNTETGEVVTGVTSMNKAVRQGVRKMVDNGITGFIDHGGHHWSPEAYVTMDIRTTMANTAREAVFERQEEYGSELFQVSHHDGARPLCYPWQGKVISRNGWSGEVEDDEGNAVHVTPLEETSYGEPAGLFGINCGHYPIPFFPGFSRIRPPDQDEEANAKEYKESQQQRALERDLRNEKRELAVMKAQGAPEDEIKAQKQRVNNARDNLDSFCDKTGRARRSGREGTPINATFPDTKGMTFTRADATQSIAQEPDNVPKFQPASTREEAEAYAQEHFGNKYSSMSYKGIDVEYANTCNRVLTEVGKKYDVSPMKGIQPMNMRSNMFKGTTAEAAYHWGGDGTLFINPTYYKTVKTYTAHKMEIDSLTKTCLNGGQSLIDSGKVTGRKQEYLETLLRTGRQCVSQSHDFVEATFVHESGHMLEDKIFRKAYDDIFGTSGVYNGYNKYLSESRMKYGINISGYAIADNREYIAESFTAWWYGETDNLDPNVITVFERTMRR